MQGIASTRHRGSLFEEDYLIRTLGSIATSSDIAITELVANAWDAGASKVEITVPEKHDDALVIYDDGNGLTRDQFYERWMKLGYNRLKHQGSKVQFPSGREGSRQAYGRNGIGRHGLLCFNDEYTVFTRSAGIESEFHIRTTSESEPFVIHDEDSRKSSEQGTRLEVLVKRHLPNPENLLGVISARFLHDPQFKVLINGKSVPLKSLSGLVNTEEFTVGDIRVIANFIDSQAAAKSTIYQGIAFWQGNRLVGEPSWFLGRDSVIDGRTALAKRYTIVVQTNDLAEYILDDWSGLKKAPEISDLFKVIDGYAQQMFGTVAQKNIEQTKKQIKKEFQSQVSALSALGQHEVNEAIETITENHPTARPEVFSQAVEAIIKLEGTRNGRELISQLTNLSEEDIDGLNRLLKQWTVKDALCVLDEIDKRISVIEAIEKLSCDSTVDELKGLHPLVTEARWIFGPEYDSPEYASNRQLATVVKTLFNIESNDETFENSLRRPDLVVVKNNTMAITGLEGFEPESQLSTIEKILIIEIKKGNSTLGRKDKSQTLGYIDDFLNLGNSIGSPKVVAFLVGHTISPKVSPVGSSGGNDGLKGSLNLVTYSQLIDTARRRLFGLRKKLRDRYESLSGEEAYQRVVQENLEL